MKKKPQNIFVYIGVLLITILLMIGVSWAQKTFFQEEGEKKTREKKGEYALRAVYLVNGEGCGLFVDLTSRVPFTGTIPEGELYDKDGARLKAEDLGNGDVVNIWGNGVMAESYPAQYHGIYKMERQEEENREYAKQYGHLLEEFCPEADPSQIPFLNLCYTQPEAVVTAAVLETGGYTWTYEKENKEKETITVDAPLILQMKSLTEIKTGEKLEVGYEFSREPQRTETLRWTMKEREHALAGGEVPEGESVDVFKDGQGRPCVEAEPGYVYEVKGIWENGEVSYGFQVTEQEEKQGEN